MEALTINSVNIIKTFIALMIKLLWWKLMLKLESYKNLPKCYHVEWSVQQIAGLSDQLSFFKLKIWFLDEIRKHCLNLNKVFKNILTFWTVYKLWNKM